MSTFYTANALHALLTILLIVGNMFLIFNEIKKYIVYAKRSNERKQKIKNLMNEGKRAEALLYASKEHEKNNKKYD